MSIKNTELIFSLERLTESLEVEISHLMTAHSKEIGNCEELEPSISWDIYRITQQSGSLRIFTARREGVLKGYAAFVIDTHPHFASSIQAFHDTFFLTQDERKGTNGIKFLKFCDQFLKMEEYIEFIYHHVNVKRDFGKILERMGYEKVETVYARRLN